MSRNFSLSVDKHINMFFLLITKHGEMSSSSSSSSSSLSHLLASGYAQQHADAHWHVKHYPLDFVVVRQKSCSVEIPFEIKGRSVRIISQRFPCSGVLGVPSLEHRRCGLIHATRIDNSYTTFPHEIVSVWFKKKLSIEI